MTLFLGSRFLWLPGPQSNGARIHSVEKAREIIGVYIPHRYSTIDTTRLYDGGTSEECEKLTVLFHRALSSKPGDISPKNLRASLMESLKALRWQKVHIFYLHAPDRSVPIGDTLQAINDLYNEGHFEQFGLNNYKSWEVFNECDFFQNKCDSSVHAGH
ncbi:hypothetical protein BDR05DRAFT_894292 [Suillus weaverae]|nr:hypothetical protein BDR05DRAFT_894292 [Suillus weaverae]